MTGNIWMCSHLLNTEDLEFGMHEFITYKMTSMTLRKRAEMFLVKMKNKIIFLYLSI